MKKKNTMTKKRGLLIAALASLVVVGGLGLRVTAAEESPAKEYVARALADFLGKQGDSGVAAGLVEWLNGTGSQDAEFGATILSDKDAASNFNRVGTCDSDSTPDACLERGSEVFYLGTASSTVISWQNRLGRDILISQVYGQLEGFASTSIQFTMGTSTVSGVPLTGNGMNFSTSTAPNSSILNRFVLATSTQPYIDSAAGTNWSYHTDEFGLGVAATGTSKLVHVRNGEYVLGFLRAFDPTWAVTSTSNRGFSANSYVVVDYMVVNTSTSR